jgi:hypothetical protein
MSDTKRLCSAGCGRAVGANSKSGICTPCQRSGHRPKRPSAGEDSVLARMGFEVKQADEAPPATKGKKRTAAVKPSTPAAPRWQGQFRALSSALGLNPDAMLETYCREWVEATRTRALAPPPGRAAEAPHVGRGLS